MCTWITKWGTPLVGFGAVIGIWLYFGGYVKAMGDGSDKFDSMNSLFAGLAFVGMLCTLFMQRLELGLQRQELQATREELELTRKATEEQADIQMKALLLNTANVQLTETLKRFDALYSAINEHEKSEPPRSNPKWDEWNKLSEKFIESLNRAADNRKELIGRIDNLESVLRPLYAKYSRTNQSQESNPTP